MASAASVDFPPADFKLLSADGSVTIGHAHFKIAARTSGHALVQGKYQFSNGEYDVDEDWLEIRPNAELPILLNYRHAFFHADGSLDRVNAADLKSGQASCTTYVNGQAKTETAKLALADTYAGPAETLPIRDFIRRRSTGSGEFRDFSCAPVPKSSCLGPPLNGPHTGLFTRASWCAWTSSPMSVGSMFWLLPFFLKSACGSIQPKISS
jgi:hypothetical protein